MNPAEYVTPEDTLQLEGRVWWVHTLSRRKGIAGSSWARNPRMHTDDFADGPYAVSTGHVGEPDCAFAAALEKMS